MLLYMVLLYYLGLLINLYIGKVPIFSFEETEVEKLKVIQLVSSKNEIKCFNTNLCSLPVTL